MEVKIRDVTEVIQESGAAVAKFDCEGAEVSLVNVPVDILRRIEYYIIETHALEIRCAIIEKFQKAGFKLEKETCKTPSFSVLTFKIKGEK